MLHMLTEAFTGGMLYAALSGKVHKKIATAWLLFTVSLQCCSNQKLESKAPICVVQAAVMQHRMSKGAVLGGGGPSRDVDKWGRQQADLVQS